MGTDRLRHQFHNLVPFQIVLKRQADRYLALHFSANAYGDNSQNIEPSSIEPISAWSWRILSQVLA